MRGYLDLAREALARATPEPSAEREKSERSEVIPPWNQAEAGRLLGKLREALARVETAVAVGKAPPVRLAVMRTWLEVADGYIRDRELEAVRGWDALALLRAVVAQALSLATPPAPKRPS